MKCHKVAKFFSHAVSHPARGAWIEISGASGIGIQWVSRTPQGVRGLKFHVHAARGVGKMSHPARGAWIEIF